MRRDCDRVATKGQGVVVGQPNWQQRLVANRDEFIADWTSHPAFGALFGSMTNAQYVDAIYANAGLTRGASERAALVEGLNAGTLARSRVLRDLVEGEQFSQLKGNFIEAEMVKAFISSIEYRKRFGK